MSTKSCPQHGPNCDMRCKDPNVDNGMMTKVWGPPGWLFLHSIAFGYPYAINPTNQDHAYKQDHYKTFFNMIGYVLPCKYCRQSYIEFIREMPIDNYLDSRENLCRWLYIIHNKVNNKLGVANDCIPKFSEIKEFYEQFRAKCKKTNEEERKANKEKGCVKPADGTPKKCVINVIKCKEGDVTRRHNSIVYNKGENNHLNSLLNNDLSSSEIIVNSVKDWKNWIFPFIILLALNYFLLRTNRI